MSFKRKITALSFSILGALVMISYQNCAPAPGVSQGDYGQPNIIDDVNATAGLSFVQKNIELINSNSSFEVNGICSSEQTGAKLRWTLIDDVNNTLVDDGYVNCEASGFKIYVDSASTLECEKGYNLKAQLGLGNPGEILVTKRCQAESVKPVVDIALAKKSVRCQFEFSNSSGCEKVCYRTGVVYSKTPSLSANCK